MYDKGYGVPQDYNKAMENYLKAADQGNAEAQFNIGTFYLPFPEKANLVLFKGTLHYFGKGTLQDYHKAMEYYLKAAEQSFSAAQNCIGNNILSFQYSVYS